MEKKCITCGIEFEIKEGRGFNSRKHCLNCSRTNKYLRSRQTWEEERLYIKSLSKEEKEKLINIAKNRAITKLIEEGVLKEWKQ